MRTLLDRHVFVLTDTDLESRFLAIVRRVGLPLPQTQVFVNGYRVDFFWPEIGLVVEADSLRYHRTPITQTHDAQRDQAHTGAGLTNLRFTHAQVRHRPGYVEAMLASVYRRLGARSQTND